jgi:hypothetical protein
MYMYLATESPTKAIHGVVMVVVELLVVVSWWFWKKVSASEGERKWAPQSRACWENCQRRDATKSHVA